MTRELRASIDLGTNTCLLLIAEWNREERIVAKTVEDLATIVRLGEGVDRGRLLLDSAMDRTLNCLKDYAQNLKKFRLDPSEVIAVATSQARDAKNGSEFFDRVRLETGFAFRVLSGQEEALATFRGALLSDTPAQSTAVIDIGGGSTELMSAHGGQSLDLGSVRFTERFLKSDPVTDAEFWACQAAVDQELESMKVWRRSLGPAATSVASGVELLAVAGTATTLAQWFLSASKFEREKIDQVRLTRGDLHRLVEELKWRSVSERRTLTGIEEKRADVLLAGALILWRVLEVLEFPYIRVSTRGLRYGVLEMVPMNWS